MKERYELVISSQYGEAWRDPETLYRDYGREEHHDAVELMRQVSDVAAHRDGVSKNRVHSKSTMEPSIDRSRGVGAMRKPSTQMDGGVPVTTYLDILTISGVAFSAFIVFLKAASPIIVQHMKNKSAPSIVIQKGNKKIEVRSKDDLEDAIKVLNKLK